jgi:hypothetical protein
VALSISASGSAGLALQRIRVRDNGHGIGPQDAEELFVHLGGSWKCNANKSKNGKRVLHGKDGKGRFRALALGRVAKWSVTARNEAKELVRYEKLLADSKFRAKHLRRLQFPLDRHYAEYGVFPEESTILEKASATPISGSLHRGSFNKLPV